jgi:hypothetical protein
LLELLLAPAFALGVVAAADWLPVSVLLGGVVAFGALAEPAADSELGLGLALGFSLGVAPACVVAPCGGVVAELDGLVELGLLWFIWPLWAASPLAAPAAPGLLPPVLLLQESAMCFTEATVSVLLEPELGEAVPACEPELGLAAPEEPLADELLLVPVIWTSWPTCACSWLVSPVSV